MYLCSNNIHLHTDRTKLVIRDRDISLEQRQFLALKQLMLQAGQVITKDQLIEQLWEGRIVSEGSLFKLIANLRKTLSSNQLDPALIKTIHGRGYMFTGEVETLNELRSVTQNKIQPQNEQGTKILSADSPRKNKINKKIIIVSLGFLFIITFIFWPKNVNQQVIKTAHQEVHHQSLPTQIDSAEQAIPIVSTTPLLAIPLLKNYLARKNLDPKESIAARDLLANALNKTHQYILSEQLLLIQIEQTKKRANITKEARAWHMLAIAQQGLQKPDLAYQSINKAISLFEKQKLDSDKARALLFLADIEDPNKTETIFAQLDQYLAEHSDPDLNFRLHTTRAIYYSKKGELTKALNDNDQAFDIAVANNQMNNAARIMNNTAIGLQLKGHYAEAASRLYKASQLFNNQEKSIVAAILNQVLGATAMNAQQMPKAEQFWQKSLHFAPQGAISEFNSFIQMNRVQGYYRIGDFEMAQKNIDSFLIHSNDQTDPDTLAQVYAIQALLELRQENALAALKHARKAMDLRSENNDKEVDFLTALAMGKAYFSLENSTLSKKWLFKAQQDLGDEIFLPEKIELYEYLIKLSETTNSINAEPYIEKKEALQQFYNNEINKLSTWLEQH